MPMPPTRCPGPRWAPTRLRTRPRCRPGARPSAVGSERTAAARARAMADVEPDPELREAIAMQAYEEERHAYLLDHLLTHYGIPHPDEKAQAPRDAEWGFMRMGYGECFDSFFAFGRLRVAAA